MLIMFHYDISKFDLIAWNLKMIAIPAWPPYTENAYHTTPYNKNPYHTNPYIKCMEKMLVIHISYIFEKQKKKIQLFLRLFENSWTDWWQKKTETNWKKNKLKYFLKKMLSIQFPFIEIVWLAFLMPTQNFFQVILKICTKIVFCFFFQPQIEFCTQTNIFRNFLHAKFNCLCA